MPASDKRHYVNSPSPFFRSRLGKALAWCEWMARTGGWPVHEARGTVLHCNWERLPARIEPRKKSWGDSDADDT